MLILPQQITQEIQNFQKAKGRKQGLLLTKGEVIYFYDQRYCEAQYARISLVSPEILVEYDSASSGLSPDLFLWVQEKSLIYATAQKRTIYTPSSALQLRLLFRVDCSQDGDDCFLRGGFFADSTTYPRIHTVLFVDEALENLLLALAFGDSRPTSNISQIDWDIAEQAEKMTNQVLKAVAQIYLQGKLLAESTPEYLGKEE